MDDYYALLQVPPDTSVLSIRKAYRKLVKTCHPDLHPENPEAAARFVALSQAYTLLSDPKARSRYDAGRLSASAMPRQPSEQDFERFYREMRAGFGMPRRTSFMDFEKILLDIFQSPITYCLLFVFLMLLALKAGLGEMGGGGHSAP